MIERTIGVVGSDREIALITGASSGLGIEFARQLAARGCDLVLTARREQLMAALALELEARHGIQVIVEALDLATPGAAGELKRRLDQRGVEPSALINNAGFGLFGPFIEQEEAKLRDMLQLDVLALTELTHVFGRAMAARGRGRILLVASVAAYQPTPLYAGYGAAKAYVLSLGESLGVELAPRVSVSVLSPGLMDTGFLGVSGQTPSRAMTRNMVLPADAAKLGLETMFAGRSSAVTGRANRIAFVPQSPHNPSLPSADDPQDSAIAPLRRPRGVPGGSPRRPRTGSRRRGWRKAPATASHSRVRGRRKSASTRR